MKNVLASVLIAIAIVLTVALLPVSSWVFKNQLEVLNLPSSQLSEFEDPVLDSLAPRSITDPKTYSGSEPSEVLAHAVYTHYPDRNKLLQDYADKHSNDPLGWALVARLACTLGGHVPDDVRIRDASSKRDQHAVFSAGREACVKGERLEPDNAYFPYMRAMFDMNLDRLDEIPAALSAAASKQHYNSHIRDWGDTLVKAQLLEQGYRGEVARIGVEASLLFPDFAHVKAFGRYLNRKGTLKEKRDLVQVQGVICRESAALIESLVAYANTRLAIVEPLPYDHISGPSRPDAEYVKLAKAFDSDLSEHGIAACNPSAVQIYQNLSRFAETSHKYMETLPALFPQLNGDGWSAFKLKIEAIGPFVGLLSLLFSIPFALTAWGFSHISADVSRKMVPHLIFIPCWIATGRMATCDDCESLPRVGLILALMQLGLAFIHLGKGAERRSRIATILGICVAITPITLTDHSAIGGSIGFAIALWLLSKNRSGEIPKFSRWIAVLVTFLVIGFAGTQFSLNAMNGMSGLGFVSGGLLVLAAAMLFVGKSPKSALAVACSSFILFSAIYLVAVGLEVRENHSEMLAKFNFMDESERIRKMAGIR